MFTLSLLVAIGVTIYVDGALHIAARKRILTALPSNLKANGHINFRLARLAFDLHRPAETIDMLLSVKASVREGVSSIRRLYVDALLVDAMSSIIDGNIENAVNPCQAVFEYPDNMLFFTRSRSSGAIHSTPFLPTASV